MTARSSALRATRGVSLRIRPSSLSFRPMVARRSSSHTRETWACISSITGPSLACSTKAREVSTVFTCEPLQAATMLVAPAVKLIMAGTLPADMTPSTVAAVPLALGSMTPSVSSCGKSVLNFSPSTAAPVSSLP